MKEKLLELLVCPKCRAALRHERAAAELQCANCSLAFPVQDGIPVLIESAARVMSSNPGP